MSKSILQKPTENANLKHILVPELERRGTSVSLLTVFPKAIRAVGSNDFFASSCFMLRYKTLPRCFKGDTTVSNGYGAVGEVFHNTSEVEDEVTVLARRALIAPCPNDCSEGLCKVYLITEPVQNETRQLLF